MLAFQLDSLPLLLLITSFYVYVSVRARCSNNKYDLQANSVDSFHIRIRCSCGLLRAHSIVSRIGIHSKCCLYVAKFYLCVRAKEEERQAENQWHNSITCMPICKLSICKRWATSAAEISRNLHRMRWRNTSSKCWVFDWRARAKLNAESNSRKIPKQFVPRYSSIQPE